MICGMFDIWCMPFGRNSSLITKEGALDGVSAWLAHPCFMSYMVADTMPRIYLRSELGCMVPFRLESMSYGEARCR